PEKNLESVILGRSSLNEIIIKNYQGIDIIPGNSGMKNITDLTPAQSHTLSRAFLNLGDYDYFILNTSSDMSSLVLSFCMASNEIILVTSCESTSLTNTYSMLKKLSKYHYDLPVKILINQAISGKVAKKAYDHLKELVNKFLPIKIKPLGIVALDKNVQASSISRTPFFVLFPETIASKCINGITRKLSNKDARIGVMPLELFWDNYLSFLKKLHKPKKKPASQNVRLKKKNEDDPEINKTLSQIKSRLSILTKEVSDIKKSIEFYKTRPDKSKVKTLKPPLLKEVNVIKKSLEFHKARPDKRKEEILKPPLAKEIPLDFESWLKKKTN
ncbi:MAG: AAA family ATPase, partial [Desulfobacula sp.]|uniref:MinD/ParA family ATP-binding protein n=1 Tax=Desulfobacula sp. TaxID=2593537 RepID=UPI002A068B79|nr:AAA family ATPase [Desulfobacula sp.]